MYFFTLIKAVSVLKSAVTREAALRYLWRLRDAESGFGKLIQLVSNEGLRHVTLQYRAAVTAVAIDESG